MNTTMRRNRQAAARLLTALIVLITMLGPAMPKPAALAQDAEGTQVLDLPGMALTQADLAGAEQNGYLVLSAKTVVGDELAVTIGDWTDKVANSEIQITLEEAGLGLGYQFGLRLRQDPDDPRSALARDLYGSLYEFADEDGAAEGFDLLDDLSAEFEGVERIEGDAEIGDETALIRPVPKADSETRQLTIAFRAGRLIAVLRLLDFLGEEPTIAEVEELGGLLMERIDAGFAGDLPGLGRRVPRLLRDEDLHIYEVRRDQYLRLDGEDFPFDLEDADIFAARVETAGNAIDVYALSQFVQNAETDPPLPDQFSLASQLYRFDDEDAASDWLGERSDQLETGSEDGVEINELERLENVPALGDERAAFTYLEDDGEGSPSRVLRFVVQVGTVVADVRLGTFADEAVPEEAFGGLAAVQTACLTDGCPTPVTISDAVAGRMPAAGEQIAGEQGILDLPAMTLTPEDLDDEGLEDYGLSFGQMIYPDEMIASTAEFRGIDEDEVAEVLADTGFVRRYDSLLYQPEDEGDPSSPASRMAVSYVLEYADEDGAAAAFAFFEDESFNDAAEDMDEAREIGDESEATFEAGEDPGSGGEYAQIDFTFRTGNLQAGVSLVDWTGDEPDLDDVESLAERLLERVEQVREDGAPGLGVHVLRLTGPELVLSSDYYVVLDGAAVPFYGETSRTVRGRENAAAEIGLTDEYSFSQQLASSEDDPASAVWYLVGLRRFEDEDAASDWIGGTEDRITANEGFTNLDIEASSSGDEAFFFTVETVDGDTRYRSVIIRIGETVASIDLTGPETPPGAAVAALAAGQVACLDDEGCIAAQTVPSSLANYIADLDFADSDTDEGPGEGDRDETPESGPGEEGAGLYESALYGFSITYDPEVWQLAAEDDPEGDPFEWVTFSSESSTVWIVGDPNYAPDELADCVAFYLVDQGFDEGAWNAEPIDDLVEEDGRAYATYTLADKLFGLTGYLYLECRAIDDGATLVVIHFASTDDTDEDGVPEDEVAAVEDLLDGIELTGAGTDVDDGDGSTANGEGETYVSPTRGYTVTWDPESWVGRPRTDEDGIELHIMGDTLVMVVIQGVEGYDGDPETCLSEGVEASGGDTPLVESEDYPAPETVDGAAGGVYELGDFAVVYLECRTLVPGEAVVTIRFGAPSESYEAALPAVEELLAGIDIA